MSNSKKFVDTALSRVVSAISDSVGDRKLASKIMANHRSNTAELQSLQEQNKIVTYNSPAVLKRPLSGYQLFLTNKIANSNASTRKERYNFDYAASQWSAIPAYVKAQYANEAYCLNVKAGFCVEPESFDYSVDSNGGDKHLKSTGSGNGTGFEVFLAKYQRSRTKASTAIDGDMVREAALEWRKLPVTEKANYSHRDSSVVKSRDPSNLPAGLEFFYCTAYPALRESFPLLNHEGVMIRLKLAWKLLVKQRRLFSHVEQNVRMDCEESVGDSLEHKTSAWNSLTFFRFFVYRNYRAYERAFPSMSHLNRMLLLGKLWNAMSASYKPLYIMEWRMQNELQQVFGKLGIGNSQPNNNIVGKDMLVSVFEHDFNLRSIHPELSLVGRYAMLHSLYSISNTLTSECEMRKSISAREEFDSHMNYLVDNNRAASAFNLFQRDNPASTDPDWGDCKFRVSMYNSRMRKRYSALSDLKRLEYEKRAVEYRKQFEECRDDFVNRSFWSIYQPSKCLSDQDTIARSLMLDDYFDSKEFQEKVDKEWKDMCDAGRSNYQVTFGEEAAQLLFTSHRISEMRRQLEKGDSALLSKWNSLAEDKKKRYREIAREPPKVSKEFETITAGGFSSPYSENDCSSMFTSIYRQYFYLRLREEKECHGKVVQYLAGSIDQVDLNALSKYHNGFDLQNALRSIHEDWARAVGNYKEA